MSNVRKAKQFETIEQVNRTLAEIDSAMADLQGSFDRLGRLRAKLAGEYAELQSAVDDLDWQTEKEFADAMGIKESLLSSLRRNWDLPHCLVGREPRYTRGQRRRIAEILEVNSRKGTSRLRSAA